MNYIELSKDHNGIYGKWHFTDRRHGYGYLGSSINEGIEHILSLLSTNEVCEIRIISKSFGIPQLPELNRVDLSNIINQISEKRPDVKIIQ